MGDVFARAMVDCIGYPPICLKRIFYDYGLSPSLLMDQSIGASSSF